MVAPTASESGYPTSSTGVLLLLLFTHFLLLPTLRTSLRVRRQLPLFPLAVAGCLVASTSYHACYSFDMCVFSSHAWHRHADHYFSLLLPAILPLLYVWVPDAAGAAAARASLEADGEGGGAGEGSASRGPVPAAWVREDRSTPALPPPPQAPPRRPWYRNERGVLAGGLAEIMARVPAAVEGSGEIMQFRRPLAPEIAILLVYVFNAHVNVHGGMRSYGAKAGLVLAWTAAVVMRAPVWYRYGLRVRVQVALWTLLPMLLAMEAFRLDNTIGAMGHNVWHTLGFLSIHVYVHYGPILICDAGGGAYVSIGDLAEISEERLAKASAGPSASSSQSPPRPPSAHAAARQGLSNSQMTFRRCAGA